MISTTTYRDFSGKYLSKYSYGYNGMEKDNEVKGHGNSYTTEFRQYDPRLGRWLSPDPKRHWFPSMSSYCFASNTPIIGKDDNGLYTIFVNGYIYGFPNYISPSLYGTPIYHNDDIKPLKPYWTEQGDQFIKAAHQYLGDGMARFVNGSGNTMFSTASSRQNYGKKLGKKMAKDIIADIYKLNHDDNPNNDVTELNFVTHSMGAAVAEGMVEEFMKHKELKKLLENGEIIHFSACDANNIVISENSKNLKRTQLNYFGDKTLAWADMDAQITGGYRIKGVTRMGVIHATVQELHPKVINKDKYDLHYDSKTFKHTWDFLKALDRKTEGLSSEQLRGEFELRQSDLNPIEDTPLNNENTKNKG